MDDNGDLDREAFRNALNERTRLVAFTAVSNALGTVNPVAELTREAHAAGARVLVDAAQAVPVQAMDVRALDCDFLAFSGHKVFGPTGIGVLYGKSELLEAMPPVKGGGDMILSVTFEKTAYNALPYKLEAGTAHIAGAIGLGQALAFVRELGYAAIEAHETALLSEALEALQSIDGLRLVGTPDRRKGIISFLVDDIHPHDLGTILDQEGVAIRAGHHCAQPVMAHYGVAATARVSFSIYNNRADIEHLVAGIRRAQEIFR
jgi:cysteine desulfurase/selenocysteine lyase